MSVRPTPSKFFNIQAYIRRFNDTLKITGYVIPEKSVKPAYYGLFLTLFRQK